MYVYTGNETLCYTDRNMWIWCVEILMRSGDTVVVLVYCTVQTRPCARSRPEPLLRQQEKRRDEDARAQVRMRAG